MHLCCCCCRRRCCRGLTASSACSRGRRLGNGTLLPERNVFQTRRESFHSRPPDWLLLAARPSVFDAGLLHLSIRAATAKPFPVWRACSRLKWMEERRTSWSHWLHGCVIVNAMERRRVARFEIRFNPLVGGAGMRIDFRANIHREWKLLSNDC